MKKIISFIILSFMMVLNLSFINTSHSANLDSIFTDKNGSTKAALTDIQTTADLSDQPLPVVIGNLIKTVLGLSGVIALIFIVWGGIMWMSSQGKEDQIKNARKLMVSGVVGIAIIAGAYAIADFVISQISGTIQ